MIQEQGNSVEEENKEKDKASSGRIDSENEHEEETSNNKRQNVSTQVLISQDKFMENLMNFIEQKIDQKLGQLNLTSQLDQNSGVTRKSNVDKGLTFDEPKTHKFSEGSKLKIRDLESSGSEEEQDKICNREEQEFVRRRTSRQSRPVADWKIRYDGRDEGRKLNKFIQEVEFTAEAEGLSRNQLYQEALHLFSGEARTWYINARQNEEFNNWTELVAELKLEFQPPDLDFHYEQQAVYRKQRRGEKFNEFYNAMNEYFSCMSVPLSEQRMFDIVFRNMRQDYRNALVVKGVRNLKALRTWGRKLDSVNWTQYRNREVEGQPRTAQVNEVSRPNFQKEQPRSQNNSNSFWRKPEQNTRTHGGTKQDWIQPVQKPNHRRDEPMEGSSNGTLEKRIAEHKVPGSMVCFNCLGKNHHYKTCLLKTEIFCKVCGFHDFTTENCPYCTKNGRKSS